MCGIEIRETDGRRFDTTIGDPSREDWFNRRRGIIYISLLKMDKSAMGTPYELVLDQEMRDAIEVTLAPGALEANRKYLINVGLNKQGLPLPVGKKTNLVSKRRG